MRLRRPFGNRATTRLSALGAVLALLLSAGAVAQDKQEKKEDSVLPPTQPGPADPKPGTEPKPEEGEPGLELGQVRIGREAPVAPRKGIDGSFITNTAELLELDAEAKVKGRSDLDLQVKWSVAAPGKFALPKDAVLTGPKLSVKLRRAGGNPTGTGSGLALTLTATVSIDGRTSSQNVTFIQDERDRLRQEYVDLGRALVPARDEFLDRAQFAARFGRRYRGVTFDELNATRHPATSDRYSIILATENLVRTVHRTRLAYRRTMTVTSAFRNPVRQKEVHAEVGESHHQYGRAADLFVPPDSKGADGKPIASEADWLKLATAALKGGGHWIEPMLDCHVNTDGCHVHVDVRDEGPRSVVATVSGQVTDPTNNPVPNASVKLAGMPAVTNAAGRYQIKHVVTPGQTLDLQVVAQGRGEITRQVTLQGDTLEFPVSIPADPMPTFIATAEPAARDGAGASTVRLELKNVGMSEARLVKVTVTAVDPMVQISSVLPAELASIAAGSEGGFSIQMLMKDTAPDTLQPRSVLLNVNVICQTPSGETRSQLLTATAAISPPVATPPPTLPSTPAATRPTGVITSPSRGGVDVGAVLGGLLAGALAALVVVAANRQTRAAIAAAEAEAEKEREVEVKDITPAAAFALVPEGTPGDADGEETPAALPEPTGSIEIAAPAEAEDDRRLPRVEPETVRMASVEGDGFVRYNGHPAPEPDEPELSPPAPAEPVSNITDERPGS
jgi:hypothetical protein